ncbi:putative GPI-anchor transamidase [Giardia muris]|uniref:Putative GPI-anchor transamidase n=1 Tax=Giardia muris TaxID=5742 RepID=A0A4Z1SNW8_GIAMU|nr:putative GPI-anchor transamidase [Giardia muris]|eukprot:TNJ27320.1 putative GPI-anchor transamidase [Giardia muris]
MIFCLPLIAVVLGELTVLLSVDTSRGPHDGRHSYDVQLVSKAFLDAGLVDRIVVLSAAETRRAGRNLLERDPGWIPSAAPAHSVSPSLLLRYIRDHLWREGCADTLMIFIAGHGSPGFIRFQDTQLLYKKDLERALLDAHGRDLFRRVILLVDSCHAEAFVSILPGKLWYTGVGSSLTGEASLSIQHEPLTGIPLVDRFSLALAEALQKGYNGEALNVFLTTDTFSQQRLRSTIFLTGAEEAWFRGLV